MVRKQLYITEAQERALKRRARALDVSEAELTRRALNNLLQTEAEAPHAATEAARQHALDELLENAHRISQEHRFPDGYRFDREALYEERATRWTRHSK